MTDTIRDTLAVALGDGYSIGRELGGGGMSRVWIARDETLGRDVVVKLLSPDLAQDLSVERFTREVRLAAGLQHAHIVPLLTAGVTSDNLPYYLMPFVEGESLRARLDRSPDGEAQPIAVVVSVLRDVCRALAYAHSRGVVHRDIKPDNILVSGGAAIVADFGIAKAMSTARGSDTQSSAALTRVGVSIGSPAYMSPEQGSGDPETDHRTDIYALGITAYELLTGRPPFTQPTATGQLMAHFTEIPVNVKERRPDIPDGLAALVMSCLAKSPDERPQSADELATALGESALWSGGGTTAPRVVTTMPAATKPALARRALVLGGAVAVVALGVAAFSYLRRPSGLESNLVAVMPFTVRDSSVQLWREGLVDVLARSLDGAGVLRTVSASTSIAQSPERADAAAAQTLGQSVGAGLVLFGDIALEGRDSVHIRYAVYDVAAARTRSSFDVRGERTRMDALADSMALRVLREIGGGSGGTLSNVGTRSVPAMRAFLQGQQLYRRGVVDSARNAYMAALESDSTFALAWRGVASVYIRQGREDEPDAVHALDMAIRYKSGRSPRDSMLLRADSLRLAFRRRAPGATDAIDAIPILTQLFATLERATATYPSDAELWFERGDAAFHFGARGDVPLAAATTWFDRGVALDSTFLVTQFHLLELATNDGNTDIAARSARRIAAMSTGERATFYRALAGVLEAQPLSKSTRALLDSIPVPFVGAILQTLATMPDSGGVALKLAGELAARPLPLLAANPDSVGFRDVMALVFASRGRGREALIWSRSPGLPLQLWRTGIVSRDSAVLVAQQLLARDPRQAVGASRLFAELRDTVSMRRLLVWSDSADAAAARASGPATPSTTAALSAFARLAVGDSSAALSALLAIPMSACSGAPCAGSSVAALLAAQGRPADAARVFDRWLPSATARLDVPVDWMARARIAEQLGDSETAARLYRRVAIVWRGGDAEVRSFVNEAKEGVVRTSRR